MRYEFGDYTLDTNDRALRHSNDPVDLPPRVFQVLAYLVANRARVVPKDELLEAIWSRLEDDDVLADGIRAARRAVGDDGRRQRVIKTRHGLGYRFVAAVVERPQDAGTAEGPRPGRRPAVRPDGRFVGRDTELALLRDRLARARAGRGQAIGLIGAPGIGKSRLLEEFRRGLPAERVTVLAGHCRPDGDGTPYLPVVELVRALAPIGDGQDPDRVLARHHAALARGESPEESGLLLLELLGIPVERARLERLTPQARRTRTFALLRELLFEAAAARPLVVVIEDLHWIDATSAAWLAELAAHLGGAAILLLVTYRPPYCPAWLGPLAASQLALAPLSAQDSERLLESLVGGPGPAQAIAPDLVAKADGNPFFLEELSRALGAAAGAARLSEVPDTVQDVLAARIAQLDPTCKALLQSCAVIGTPIPYGLLCAVSETAEARLDRGLAELAAAGFLSEDPGAAARALRFKHALTQEATYRSLRSETRAALHGRIAQALEEGFEPVVAGQPEVLARHHTGAGNRATAVGYWQRAGRAAYERSANEEAIGYAQRGLRLLAETTAAEGRAETELSLQLTLAPALVAAKGYGAPEVEPVYRRARELCAQIGDEGQLFRTLVGLWNYHWVSGELVTARDVARELRRLAERANDPARALRAHAATGEILFHTGELEAALWHLEVGITLYGATEKRSPATQIPEVVCLCYAAWALWHTGRGTEARARAEEAVALARELGHPMSLALCLALTSELHQFALDVAACGAVAEQAVALSRAQGLPFWEGTATILLGWAEAMEGAYAQGHRTLQDGLEIFVATGARVQRTAWLGMLAEIRCHGGRHEEGLESVEEALSWVDRTGERYYQPELERLRGELLVGLDRAEEGERAFAAALETARRQGARMRELRANVSLARLRLDQGRGEEALALLRPAKSWFETTAAGADLARARTLLQGLA